MKKLWKVAEPTPADFFTKFPELPPTVAALLYNRNITTQKKIDEFLNPDYSQDVHDPFLFKDMQKAVDRIFEAIEKDQKIIIHGDYDADGVSASVILYTTLKALSCKNVDVFIPHREIDGYGLNLDTVKLLKQEGADVIITVDCAITNYEQIELANKLEIDTIVTDHHKIPEQVPPAYAIIHPQNKDDNYPDPGLCGAAVAFKLAQGLLREQKKQNRTIESDLSHEGFEKWLLDMVAIATVADMVPLVGESRTLTKYGLVVLNKTKRIGLQKLLLEARLMHDDGSLKRTLNCHTIGFQIAPRINAAGRMNHANVAYNLLITDDPIAATDLAFELNENNKHRQKITEDYVKRACEQIERDQKDKEVLVAFGEDWPLGVVGLIAGKIKEKYYKPSLAISGYEGELTGSGRSIDAFNIIEALDEVDDLLLKYGGHPAACGFTLKPEVTPKQLQERLAEIFIKKTKGIELIPQIKIDAKIDLSEVNWGLYELLEKFEPFGQGNLKPRYLAEGLEIVSIKPVGKDKKHLTIMVKHQSNKIIKTIGWNLCNSNNGNPNWCNLLQPGDNIDIVLEVDVNEWNGNRSLQLTIIDLKKN